VEYLTFDANDWVGAAQWRGSANIPDCHFSALRYALARLILSDKC
jgi:hypothetical protein